LPFMWYCRRVRRVCRLGRSKQKSGDLLKGFQRVVVTPLQLSRAPELQASAAC
jgi:hypothetical protein